MEEKKTQKNPSNSGLLPLKMFLHIFILILTVIQASVVISQTTTYMRSQQRYFYNIFLEESDKTDIDYSRIKYLFTFTELRNQIKTSLDNFYNLDVSTLETVKYRRDISQNIKMEVNYLDNNNDLSQIQRINIFEVNQNTLGPFDETDNQVRLFLSQVKEFKLYYKFQTLIPDLYLKSLNCYNWQINQIFDFSQRVHFVNRLEILNSDCPTITSPNFSYLDNFFNSLIWIHIIIMILALVSMIQTFKYILKIASLYGKVKKNYKKRNKNKGLFFISDSEDSDYYNPLMDKDYYKKNQQEVKEEPEKKEVPKEKSDIFDRWSILCLFGNFIQIIGCALCLINQNTSNPLTELTVGLGCFFAFINILRYLEYNSKYSIITKTITKGVPAVLKYLLGVFPLFFGFVFLGICIFNTSDRFKNISRSMYTLFSFSFGDSVSDIMFETRGVSFFLGQLFLYSFGIIFCVVVVNIFISITEEAYMTTSKNNKYYWLYSYLKLDERFVELKEKEDEIKVLPQELKKKENFPPDYKKSFKDKEILSNSFIDRKGSKFESSFLAKSKKNFNFNFERDEKTESFKKSINSAKNLKDEINKKKVRIEEIMKAIYKEDLARNRNLDTKLNHLLKKIVDEKERVRKI